MTACHHGQELSIAQRMIELENSLSRMDRHIACLLDLDRELTSDCSCQNLGRSAQSLLMLLERSLQEALTQFQLIKLLQSKAQLKDEKAISMSIVNEPRK